MSAQIASVASLNLLHAECIKREIADEDVLVLAVDRPGKTGRRFVRDVLQDAVEHLLALARFPTTAFSLVPLPSPSPKTAQQG